MTIPSSQSGMPARWHHQSEAHARDNPAGSGGFDLREQSTDHHRSSFVHPGDQRPSESFEIVRLNLIDNQRTSGDRCKTNKGANFQVVALNCMVASTQFIHTRDDQSVGSNPFDLRSHLDQHPGQSTNMRLACSVPDRGFPLREGCRHNGILSSRHRGLIKENIGPHQATCLNIVSTLDIDASSK